MFRVSNRQLSRLLVGGLPCHFHVFILHLSPALFTHFNIFPSLGFDFYSVRLDTCTLKLITLAMSHDSQTQLFMHPSRYNDAKMAQTHKCL